MSFLGPVDEHLEEVAAGLNVAPGDIARRMIEAAFSPEKDEQLFISAIRLYHNTLHDAAHHHLYALWLREEHLTKTGEGVQVSTLWKAYCDSLRNYIVHGLTSKDYWQELLDLAESIRADQLSASEVKSDEKPFYETATTDEWLAAFTAWTNSHCDLPTLPEQNYDRAYFYEERG